MPIGATPPVIHDRNHRGDREPANTHIQPILHPTSLRPIRHAPRRGDLPRTAILSEATPSQHNGAEYCWDYIHLHHKCPGDSTLGNFIHASWRWHLQPGTKYSLVCVRRTSYSFFSEEEQICSQPAIYFNNKKQQVDGTKWERKDKITR